MDPLDYRPANPNYDPWANLLGIGNNAQKAKSEKEFEQDLLARYPFSSDCATQRKIVDDLQAESAQTLNNRNNAKMNSTERNDLTGKLRAFDKYIPQALDYINTVCGVNQGNQPLPNAGGAATVPGAGATNVLGTTAPGTGAAPTPVSTGAGSMGGNLPSVAKSNTKTYLIIGLVAAVVIGGGIYLYKRSKG